jgi:hypothetical protein
LNEFGRILLLLFGEHPDQSTCQVGQFVHHICAPYFIAQNLVEDHGPFFHSGHEPGTDFALIGIAFYRIFFVGDVLDSDSRDKVESPPSRVEEMLSAALFEQDRAVCRRGA